MNTVVLRRRLIYIGAIVLLLVPLFFMGNPSVRNQDGTVKTAGGALAKLRDHYDLGQGDLGEISPASESMRLATLGLRGVAATILWQKAEAYKREKNWDRLSASLNQIAVLQPHFVNVWEFQSHNLAYNVSAEFDDYRQRYQWVQKGINFMIKGSKFNKTRTEMPYELGWYFGNKFGVSDEKKQFRTIYRDDKNFHQEVLASSGLDLVQRDGLGPDNKPDNWLSGRLWYERSYDMVTKGSKPAKSTMMFYRMSPQWLMKYAEGIQSEGILDTPARQAWSRAGAGWKEFGERPIPTTFGDTIYLRELERANENYARLKAEFEEFCGDTYQKILDEKMSQLTTEQLAAWSKLDIDRSFDEVLMAEDVGRILSIPPESVAKEVPSDKRLDAIYMANTLQAAQEKISHIEIYRNQINFAYWEARCLAEQENEAVLARTNMYRGKQSLDRGELELALEQYETAFTNWATLFNKHPGMMIDEAADELLESITEYQRLIDGELPDTFPLADFMKFREVYESQLADPAMMSVIASWPKRFPNRDFLTEMLRKSSSLDELLEQRMPTLDMELPEKGQAPSPVAPAPAASQTPAATTDSNEDGDPTGDAAAPSASSDGDVAEATDAATEPAADTAASQAAEETTGKAESSESPGGEELTVTPAESAAPPSPAEPN
ncbi:MAG: hypothetical protein KDB22_15950 [Planctomycetales bacterium]|nr:hypothetical protein [Planctomycetales bacterium]